MMDEGKTFKSYTNVSDDLDKKDFFKMLDGDKFIAKIPQSLKKNFNSGVVIP